MPAKALFFEPMLCEKAEQPPEDPEWRYELKLDGYRAIGFTSEGRARLWSRNGKDFGRQFSEVAKAIASLPEDTAIDGEFVALDADGKPSFALLQGSGAGAAPVVFYAFDLAEGTWGSPHWRSDASACAENRRPFAGKHPVLRGVRRPSSDARAGGPGEWTRRHRRETGGQCDRSGRSGDWIKGRANRGQELVIGGYVPASNTFDSLLVGYYEGRDLMYAGRIRAGLVADSRRALLLHFAELRIEHCPFRNLPERTSGRWGEGLMTDDMDKCRWLAPRRVAAVEFLEWTPDFRLRHPRFGLALTFEIFRGGCIGDPDQ